MKNYEKPVLLVNEELAEGVYAASGINTCYTVSYNIHQSPQDGGSGEYRIQFDGAHSAEHHGSAQTLVISFNQSVNYVGSNGSLVSGNNTSSLEIDFAYHQNGGDNIGFGDLIVNSNAGLSVTGATVYCNGSCGQH